MKKDNGRVGRRYSLSNVGLFAGIGGIELGMQQAGHRTDLLCEIDSACQEVLRTNFDTKLVDDICRLKKLPRSADLITAGFPCQDLSQAGTTRGIGGSRSGLVGEVFRLLEGHPTSWVLLENVPFMLQLSRGRAMDVIVSEFERLGYRWAYRVVDSRSFGLPQRRRRVYFLAAKDDDPRTVLFADNDGEPPGETDHENVGCGFYWTEGLRGLGWAVNCVPTLKGGSTVGIPSPPAILMPGGAICKPEIRDAERLQGFGVDWTRPAEVVQRPSCRWRLVGNAVSVPAAAWVADRLAEPGEIDDFELDYLDEGMSWPTAAWNVDGKRVRVKASEWPVKGEQPDLLEFLQFPLAYLSRKATAGFLSRAERSSLRFPSGFLNAMRDHLEIMETENPNLKLFESRAQYSSKIAATL